ncbi:Guanine deaminase [Symmachiella dynata]|uniref:guanine deaminase n=1 Tax=Symmachiella dynata TaxID=2527995 RepID=UPI001187D5F4|nr:guanine deaminase [Symmachiella dynata]QDT48864.1 Guanine deaminase [Symmachiella dynata]
MNSYTAIRGCFFDFIDDPWKHLGNDRAAARFERDGLLVIEEGIIRDFGPYADLAEKYSGVPLTHIRDRMILPGFIDGHIHFPQTRVLGAHGAQLLDWLQTSIFPEEEKYADRDYAEEAAEHFFNALLAGGTTTCQAFTTSSPVSTEAFFEEAARRQMRVIAGLTGIDKFAPPDTLISADDFYRESKRLIEQYHRCGRNLYAITPRFAVGCTEEMLTYAAQLKREHEDCWINTHISENPTEVRAARTEFPECSDYTAVHEKHGLLGAKFTAGHGIWLSNDEFRRFSQAGAALAFCPMSNLFLGSGLFRLGRALDPEHPVRLALGSDMGAGNAFSLIRVLDEAYKVGLCNNTMLDGSVNPLQQDLAEAERNKLNPYRAFYLATLGGARALYLDDLLGNFQPGKEADFVALDWTAGQQAISWRQSLTTKSGTPATIDEAAELLFGIMALSDDRSVAETWIAGQCAYRKESTDTARDAAYPLPLAAPQETFVNPQHSPASAKL